MGPGMFVRDIVALSLAGFKAASTLQNTGGTHMAPRPSAFLRLSVRQACSPLITWISPPQTSLCTRSTHHALKGKWPPPASQPASSVSQAGVSHSGPYVLSKQEGGCQGYQGLWSKGPLPLCHMLQESLLFTGSLHWEPTYSTV